MIKQISINDYLAIYLNVPVIDVRSPREYAHAHIKNSVNIPLFNNDERAHVGTVYKQQSKEAAIELGYTYVNPKLEYFVQESKKLAKNNKVVVHCWRGGMRSAKFAELLSDNGLDVYQIIGGYKAFRNTVTSLFFKDWKLFVLGGFTGSGKTKILQALKGKGQQIADLEDIAKHRGSAFGALPNELQPTSEAFENNLFWVWRTFDIQKPIWVEDESQNIGNVNIQQDLFKQMRQSPVLFINIPQKLRAEYLVDDYGAINNDKLANAIQRISKRLGGLRTKETLAYLSQNDYFHVAFNCLSYYDKYYKKGLAKRMEESIFVLDSDTIDVNKNADKLLEFSKSISTKKYK